MGIVYVLVLALFIGGYILNGFDDNKKKDGTEWTDGESFKRVIFAIIIGIGILYLGKHIFF